jgi:hypothetical protein
MLCADQLVAKACDTDGKRFDFLGLRDERENLGLTETPDLVPHLFVLGRQTKIHHRLAGMA